MLSKEPLPQGFLVLDKPAGITSRDAVDQALRWFPRMKLGHAGTLDPAATGVLVLGVGPSATRLIEYLQDQEKEYLTTITLGGTSTTDDAEGEIVQNTQAQPVLEEQLRAALNRFVGVIEQVPPAFSAARIEGERAHTKARRGEQVKLQPRRITVHAMELIRYEYPEISLRIRCSKGTYIRSIARDLGLMLYTGGYVSTLRRTRIGNLLAEQAVDLSVDQPLALAALLPLHVAGDHLLRCQVDADQALRLQQGQTVTKTLSLEVDTSVTLWQGDNFLGIGEYLPETTRVRPMKMLAY